MADPTMTPTDALPPDHPDAPMGREEYERLLGRVHALRLTAMSISYRLDQAIALAQRSEDIGTILDPTLWRDKHQALREDIQIMAAVRDLGRLGDEA